MANAGGRLLGTIASGLLYQWTGLTGALWGAIVCLLLAWLISFKLPREEVKLTGNLAQLGNLASD